MDSRQATSWKGSSATNGRIQTGSICAHAQKPFHPGVHAAEEEAKKIGQCLDGRVSYWWRARNVVGSD